MLICLLSGEQTTFVEAIPGLIFIVLITICIIVGSKRKKIEAEKAAKEEAQTKATQLQQFINDVEAHINNFGSNGLPQVKNIVLQLDKGEVCHFCGDATYCKIKNQVVGQTSSYHGYSFSHGKGGSSRSGLGKKEIIRRNVEYRTDGQLYITNKRVVFVAPVNSKQISISSIVSITPYNQNFVIVDNKGENIFDVSDRALFLGVFLVVCKATSMGLDLQKLSVSDCGIDTSGV